MNIKRLCIFLIIITSLFIGASILSRSPDKNDIVPYVRLVYGPNIGSGVIFADDEDKYFVLTSAHLIDQKDHILNSTNKEYIDIDLFNENKFVGRISGHIEYSKKIEPKLDLCVISFLKKDVKLHTLHKAILAPYDLIINNEQIKTYGFPFGAFLMSVNGFIFDETEHVTLFAPIALPGQSGSPLLTVINDKEYIVGIIVKSSIFGPHGDYFDNKGYPLGYSQAIKLSTIHEFLLESKINVRPN